VPFGDLRSAGRSRLPLSSYDAASWHSKVAVSLDPAWTLTGAYIGTALDDAGRTDQAGRGDVRLYDNRDHLAYLRLRRQGAGRFEQLGATLSYHRAEEHVDRFDSRANADGTVTDPDATLRLDPANLKRKVRYDDAVDVVGGSLDAALHVIPGRLRLDAGLEAYRDRVGSERADARASDGFVFVPQARGNFSAGSTYDTFGAFLHGQAALADWGERGGRVLLDAGLRASRFAAHAPFVPQIGDVRYRFHGLVGAAGIQYLRARRLNLYTTLVQGFRAPNLQETTVLGNTGSKFEIPNANLRPERADVLELGAKVNLKGLRLHVAAFESRLDDVIDEIPAAWEGESTIDGRPVIQRVNAATGTYRGAEGSVEVALGPWTFSSAVAGLRGDVTSIDGVERPARRIPPLHGGAGVRRDWSARRAYCEGFVQWAARQNRLHPGDEIDLRICETKPYSGRLREACDGTPGWATLNLRAGTRVARSVRADVALYNLTDELYRWHGSGIDAPGLDVRSTLSFEF
jgi:outer membrane receptor protein involved in Fe transport